MKCSEGIGDREIGVSKDWVVLPEQSSHEKDGAILENPSAVKLLDFFKLSSQKEMETESRFEVDDSVRDSAKAAELKAVSAWWLELWIRQWKL